MLVRKSVWRPAALSVVCWALSAGRVDADVPHLIRYQGQAVDSQQIPLEGPYTLTFRLYDAQTAGTKVWEEAQANVPLQGGHFSVLLGQVTPLTTMDWSQPRWLSVQVGVDPELAPRQQITSVPLAIRAETAERLDATTKFQLDSGGTLPTGLTAYWKLDEPSGSRADAKGTNSLADHNTVTQATGKVGDAAQFTAANSEYLSIADNADLSVGDEDFTIAAWVYLDSLGVTRYIASKSTTGLAAGWDLAVVSTNKAFFHIANGSAQDEFPHSLVLSAATWYFVVAWHDSVANTINIQVNDGTPESLATTIAPVDNAVPFTLGTFGGAFSNFWDGRIDEVGFWKRVLTAQERSDLYNAGNGNTFIAPNRGPWLEDEVGLSYLSGNVGIGTTSPHHKLVIGSNLHATADGIVLDGVFTFYWGSGVPTPPASWIVYLWLDTDGSLKVKFSNGVVRTIASPN